MHNEYEENIPNMKQLKKFDIRASLNRKVFSPQGPNNREYIVISPKEVAAVFAETF